MLTKSTNDIYEKDLQELIDNCVLEEKSLEYKSEMPGRKPGENREFLADVSSFANAVGGDIIYGIACDPKSGAPTSIVGLFPSNWDQEIQRLENLMRDGIKPRLSGVQIQPIKLPSDKYALIIRVPKSWNPPHRVTHEGHDKFYGRNTKGKYPLDVEELRNLFNLSATVAERIRNFRIDRVNKVLSGDTPVPLFESPAIILHIIPVISFNPGQVYDISIESQRPHSLLPINSAGWETRFNLDGIVAFAGPIEGKYCGYAQLFKNGIIEAVDVDMLAPNTKPPAIPSVIFERELLRSLRNYLILMKQLSIELPAYVFLTVLKVKGFTMATSGSWWHGPPLIDRDHLLIPETIIESYDARPQDVLHPCFDSVWNACGYSRSLLYDANSEWTGQESQAS